MRPRPSPSWTQTSGSDGAATRDALQKLGVLDQIRAKTTIVANAGAVAELVGKDEAEICIFYGNEMGVNPNVDVVGTLPAEFAPPTDIVAFISTQARDAVAAKALVDYLASLESEAVYPPRRMGWCPCRSASKHAKSQAFVASVVFLSSVCPRTGQHSLQFPVPDKSERCDWRRQLMRILLRGVAMVSALAISVDAQQPAVAPPLRQLVESRQITTAKQGYFFVGGRYFDADDGRLMSGQMYVEFYPPAKVTRPLPLVMFSGGGQSGLNYTGTPDGRDGWMQYFVRQGYAVYVTRSTVPRAIATSAGDRPTIAQQRRKDRAAVHRSRAIESMAAGAAAHAVAWNGRRRGPVFDQFFAQIYPSLASFPRQQELNRDAGAALLDRSVPRFC